MKLGSIKRMLTAALVTAMLAGSVLGVSASGSPTSDSGVPTPSEAVIESAPAVESATSVSSNGNVKVAGTTVKNTVSGSIVVKSLQGVAVTTPAEEVKASLGLKAGQVPHIMVFDTDAKKSNLAMNCVNAAAAAVGADVVSTINVTLNAKENGKYISLSNGSAGMVVGLPKKADLTKTYFVVCVQPGGVVTILNDQDLSPATVTFEIKAGLGTYAMIAK